MGRIEDRAVPFQDKEPEDVIKRLLDKTETDDLPSTASATAPADLVARGGRIPHGSKLRATYKGAEYEAVVDDGKIVWNGRRFESLSKAAVAVIQSTGTNRETENGWRFWEVQLPGSSLWQTAQEMRSSDGETVDELVKELKRSYRRLSEKQKREVLKELEMGSAEDPFDSSTDRNVFVCTGRGAYARGMFKEGNLTVLQGSKAALQSTDAAQRATTIREKLKKKGVLKPDGDNTSLIFMRDELFSSPSAAARAVLGRSANGWDEWKTKDGRTLDQIERR
jgi:hypothetical protein